MTSMITATPRAVIAESALAVGASTDVEAGVGVAPEEVAGTEVAVAVGVAFSSPSPPQATVTDNARAATSASATDRNIVICSPFLIVNPN